MIIFINILFSLLLQYSLLHLNKLIKYNHERKVVSIIISALFAIIVSLKFDTQLYRILTISFFICLLNITFIDYKYLEIPDTYNIIVAVLGVFNVFYFKNFSYLITGIISFVVFFLISLISKGALGGGDIKLSLGIGMFISLKKYLNFIMLTFGIGAVIALFFMITKGKNKEDKLPFAPFMSLGAILTLLIS